MQLTAYLPNIPATLQRPGGTARSAKEYALAAIAAKLPPTFLTADAQRTTVYLTAEERQLLEEAVRQRRKLGDDTASGRLLGQWCAAWIARLQDVAVPAQASPPVASERPDQELYYERMVAGLDVGRIVLCEGATGLGKGRVLARAALRMVQAGKGPVKIASPSLSVLRQNLREWYAIAPPDAVGMAAVLGRASFCDPLAVQAMAMDPEVPLEEDRRQAVLDWLDGGARPVPGSGTDDLARAGTVAYLLDDLFALLPEASEWSGIALQPGEPASHPAEAVYLALREQAAAADVTLTTHAMIAYDLHLTRRRVYAERKHEQLRRGGGRAPHRLDPADYARLHIDLKREDAVLIGDCRVLLIDEAHLFEQAIAAVESSGLSLMTLRTRLKSMSYSSQDKRDKAIRACKDVLSFGAEAPTDDVIFFPADWAMDDHAGNRVPAYYRLFLSKLQGLDKALGAMASARKGRPAFLDEALVALRQILNRRKPIRFDMSPVRRWPTLTVGPISVAAPLSDLWASLDAAALVSATLFLPDRFGGRNTGYIQQLLSIPPERACSAEPVTPAWVTSPVTLHRPADVPELLAALSPPSETGYARAENGSQQEFHAACKRWIDEVATWVGPIARQATGGTLVLLTAYDWIDHLAEQLLNRQLLAAERLVVQQRGQSFLQCLNRYRELAASGQRPVWLATGAAWTGLDLNDRELPGLLENLVVPRLPFGTQQSMTSAARKRKKQGGHGDSRVNEAAFIFRQGIGRLVRHPDVRDKHLWILDGRIWLPRDKTGEAFFQVFRNLLAVYTQVDMLREPDAPPAPPGGSRKRKATLRRIVVDEITSERTG